MPRILLTPSDTLELTNRSPQAKARLDRSPGDIGAAPRTHRSPEPGPRTDGEPDAADIAAAQLFDEALLTARDLTGRVVSITNKEVAALCGVSESLVRRWRSPNYRDSPSLRQMLRLPVTFHVALHRALNHRYGFGRQALARLLEAAGDVALVLEP